MANTMVMRRVGVLLLVLAHGCLAEQQEFDYFLLVRQWAGSFCSTRECPLVHFHGYKFTIHGLWPNYHDGSYPQFCDKSQAFNPDTIQDLMPELLELWPSYLDSDDNFWEHEWSKHGTCSLNVLSSEHAFFKKVLDLNRQFDLAAALQAQDIVPSDTTVYKVSAVQDAIYEMYKVGSQVHCDPKGQLSEIWMCISRDFKAMECPGDQGRANKCQQVRIPPMPQRLADPETDPVAAHPQGDSEETLLFSVAAVVLVAVVAMVGAVLAVVGIPSRRDGQHIANSWHGGAVADPESQPLEKPLIH